MHQMQYNTMLVGWAHLNLGPQQLRHFLNFSKFQMFLIGDKRLTFYEEVWVFFKELFVSEVKGKPSDMLRNQNEFDEKCL